MKSAGLDQDGGTPVLDVDPTPPASEHQYIQAVAGNDTGATITGVRVQVWAYAAATAAASGLYLGSMGGPQGVLIPPNGTPIDIGSMQQQPFTRNWDATYGLTSTDPDIVSHFVDGQVHCCIYGNVYQEVQDASSAPVPDSPNPAAFLDVASNRHHAQRNMTIKKHPVNAKMAFPMFAANPDPERDQPFSLQAAERRPDELQPWELAELDAQGPWIRRAAETPDGGIPGIELVIDGKSRPLRAARGRLDDLELEIEGEGAGPERAVELGADEARRMFVNATVPDEDFVLRIIDIVQAHEDRVVGGMRLMLLAVPPELIQTPRAES